MSKKKKPLVLNHDEFDKKGTKELLGYLKRLQQCEISFESSDLYENPDLENPDVISFKETEKWKTAYKKVKSILKLREHLDNKK
ncbi:hypothetical protein [Psychroserpens luteus]|uniref:Uncharacterized protein n=1 Tax=Psychroserpens luteus TaxID=1434066 RepID=A0ABW5ZWA0_9FLAO|nr:hypothetical protein [Psychroserpens luteus]